MTMNNGHPPHNGELPEDENGRPPRRPRWENQAYNGLPYWHGNGHAHSHGGDDDASQGEESPAEESPAAPSEDAAPPPHSLSREQIDQLCTLLSMGAARSVAAHALGIDETYLCRAVLADPALQAVVGQALAAAEVRAMQQICKAGEKHWQAAAWYLERTRPSRYAKRDPNVFSAAQVNQMWRRLYAIVMRHVPELDRRERIDADLQELANSQRTWRHEEAV